VSSCYTLPRPRVPCAKSRFGYLLLCRKTAYARMPEPRSRAVAAGRIAPGPPIPRVWVLGIGCVPSILDSCGASIVMVPLTPGWAAAFCSTYCTAGSTTSGGPLTSISASPPSGISTSSETSSSCPKAMVARRSTATTERTAKTLVFS
jgi:hypothetical protein